MVSLRLVWFLAAMLPAISGCIKRRYNPGNNTAATTTGSQTIERIYIHWTATGYDWALPYHYHTVVTGDGTVHRITPYTIGLDEHTYYRNEKSVGIATACMGGDNPWSTPCTSVQVEAMCKEIADLAHKIGWTADKIDVKHVMTHAEAASNRDGWAPHENYGPQGWGGTGERWDFWMVKENEAPGTGGDVLRGKIKRYLADLDGGAAAAPVYEEAKSIVDETWLKRRPIGRSEQDPSEICRVGLLHSIGMYGRTEEAGHYKVKIDIPSSACPNFTGDAYIFKDHFVVTKRFDSMARPGMARSRKPTYIKARPISSGELPEAEKCQIPGNRVLAYTKRESDGIHHKVHIDITPGGCERFAGKDAYIYPPDFNFEPRSVLGQLVATQDGVWLKREPGDAARLPATKKCRVSTANVASYTDLMTEGADSRLNLDSGGAECPGFVGPVYITNGHFRFGPRPVAERPETIRATQDTYAKIDVRNSSDLADGVERCFFATGESITFIDKKDIGDHFILNTGGFPQKCDWMNGSRSVFVFKRHFGFSQGGEN